MLIKFAIPSFYIFSLLLSSALSWVSRKYNCSITVSPWTCWIHSFHPQSAYPNVQSQNCHHLEKQLNLPRKTIEKAWLSSKCNFQPPWAQQHPSSNAEKLLGASGGALSCGNVSNCPLFHRFALRKLTDFLEHFRLGHIYYISFPSRFLQEWFPLKLADCLNLSHPFKIWNNQNSVGSQLSLQTTSTAYTGLSRKEPAHLDTSKTSNFSP